MPSDQPVILLTGATGLVGGELLTRLSQDARVIALIRRADAAAALLAAGAADVLLLDNSRTAPRWPDRLRDSITDIIHCAADTRFGLPLEQARVGNVELTRRVLDGALSCRSLRRFAYVSSVYVAGRTTGHILEAPNRHDNGFCSTYQQAKHEAEQLVFAAMSELPASIYRLSAIMGDSRTGRVRQFNFVHQLIRVLPRNVLPVVPVHPEARFDLICVDWAADVLVYLFRSAFVPRQVYHVCAGPEASVPAGQIIQLTADLLRTRGAAPSIDLPRFVSLEEFNSYVLTARRRGDRLLNELLRILGYTLPHLGMWQQFDNSRCVAALAGSGLELPSIPHAYARVVEYCMKSDFGRRLIDGELTRTPSRRGRAK